MIGLNQGTKVGTYVLERQLGEGGQGSVWQATPAGTEPGSRPVALKVIPVRGSSPVTVERLKREAQALVRLSSGHPSLVGCHGVIEDPTLGVMAIVMDKVEGVDLSAALRDPRCTEGAKALMLTHVARALAHLHESGVVHRDIKPQNILITHGFFAHPSDEAMVKLVDFGIAIVTGNPKPLTEIGTVIGTPAYMSPERIDPLFWQARSGLPSEDVWAFGVVAFEAFFGRHPTGVGDEGLLSDYAERYRATSRAFEPWPPLPPNHPWEAPLRGALALRQSDRLASGAAVVNAINARRVPTTLNDPIPKHTAAQPPSAYAFQATPTPPPAQSAPVERTEINPVLDPTPGAGAALAAAWHHSPAPPPSYYTPSPAAAYPPSSPAVAMYGPPPVPQPPARRSVLIPMMFTGAAGLLVLGGSLGLARLWEPGGAEADGPTPSISAPVPSAVVPVVLPPVASGALPPPVPQPETPRTPPANPTTRPPAPRPPAVPPPQPSGTVIVRPPPPNPPQQPPPTQTSPPTFPPIVIPTIFPPQPQQPPPPPPPTQTTPPQPTPPPIGRPPPPIFTAPPPVNTAPPTSTSRPPPPKIRLPGDNNPPPNSPPTTTSPPNRPPPPRVRLPGRP